MMMDLTGDGEMSKSENLISFLEYVNRHKRFCTRHLAEFLNVSIRNIQRYKKEVEQLFGVKFIPTDRGCYTLPKEFDIESLILSKKDFEDYEKLIELLNLTNGSFLKFFGFEAKKLLNKNSEIYLIKEPPFEELINFELLLKLKSVVYHKKLIDIYYVSDKSYTFKNAKPLKIVFAKNNWYIAVLTDDEINGGFKFLRINFIKEIKEHSKTFKVPIQAKEFFKRFQTLFSSYVEPYFEVVVKVEKEIARHFRVKKFLPSQKIVKENEDGSLLLSYTVNNKNEILILAKTWLPYMKIVSPVELQDELKDILMTFLESNK